MQIRFTSVTKHQHNWIFLISVSYPTVVSNIVVLTIGVSVKDPLLAQSCAPYFTQSRGMGRFYSGTEFSCPSPSLVVNQIQIVQFVPLQLQGWERGEMDSYIYQGFLCGENTNPPRQDSSSTCQFHLLPIVKNHAPLSLYIYTHTCAHTAAHPQSDIFAESSLMHRKT